MSASKQTTSLEQIKQFGARSTEHTNIPTMSTIEHVNEMTMIKNASDHRHICRSVEAVDVHDCQQVPLCINHLRWQVVW